ncbi:MAG TPA: metallophosphoesterase [Coriobacteriia bacterium]|nr:metallophosphoesterase [Coriobacteriia bacterium]
MSRDRFVIAQISDIHCGDPRFDPVLAGRCVEQVRAAAPDLVLVPGDLTADGYPEEYEEAMSLLGQMPCPWYVVPGNHDERNVGWRTFQRLFGKRWHRHHLDFGVATSERSCARLRLVACDSAEPDLNDGELGRVRHSWITDGFAGADDDFRIVMLHHHLVAVPNTGRERNTVSDAGDVLATLAASRVDLVLSGHKHVPFAWNVNDMAVVTSGTASTWRIRGEVPPSFNLIEVYAEEYVLTTVWTSGEKPLIRKIPRLA